MAAKKKIKAIELVQPPRQPISLGRAKDAEVARLSKQEKAYKRPGAMYSPQGYADYMSKTSAQKTAKGRK
tara:strand:- start:481 stop:690 length:210 start_codon:yes stop_codon:yes gene_type:complete